MPIFSAALWQRNEFDMILRDMAEISQELFLFRWTMTVSFYLIDGGVGFVLKYAVTVFFVGADEKTVFTFYNPYESCAMMIKITMEEIRRNNS